MLTREKRKREERGQKEYSKCGFLTAKTAGNSKDSHTLYSKYLII